MWNMLNLNFPSGWLVQLFVIYSTYLLLFFINKNHKQPNNIKKQLLVATLLLLLAGIGEFIGVTFELWTYFPSNWPITVWIGYFGIGLIAYQLVKLVDRLK